MSRVSWSFLGNNTIEISRSKTSIFDDLRSETAPPTTSVRMLSRPNAPQPRGGRDKRLDAESLRLVADGSVVGMCPGKAGEERRNGLDLIKTISI